MRAVFQAMKHPLLTLAILLLGQLITASAPASQQRVFFAPSATDPTITQFNHTPSLPDAHPRSDRFRCGGRESKFLAVSRPAPTATAASRRC